MEKEVDLKIKTKKEWFLCLLLGFFIGLAVIVPGVSGATISIIFGLYAKLLYSFENVFKKFKKCILFLIPIGIGLALGFVFGFVLVQRLFNIAPFIIICLFAGLMIGSFPAVKDEIKGVKFTPSKIVLFVTGIILPIAIGAVSIWLNKTSGEAINPTWYLIIGYFFLGFVMSLTQLVPGLSCSALLMAFGQYGAILASAKLGYIKSNPLVLLAFGSMVVGFVLGIIMFSKGINKLLEKKRDATYCTIVGLSLGSIVSMFLNPEVWSVYTSWKSAGAVVFDVAIGLILLIVGIAITYLLVRYQRNKNSKEGRKGN